MNKITTVEEWEELRKSSQGAPIIVFKHSAICPISAAAYERIEEAKNSLQAPIYLVVVQESRVVSDKIAEDLQVTHESPQAIVVSDGEAVGSESHHSVNKENISAIVRRGIK